EHLQSRTAGALLDQPVVDGRPRETDAVSARAGGHDWRAGPGEVDQPDVLADDVVTLQEGDEPTVRREPAFRCVLLRSVVRESRRAGPVGRQRPQMVTCRPG